MAKRTKSIEVELRQVIAQAQRQGQTRGAIADRAGMPRSQLTRIATGESVPILTTADRVLRAIGYRLVIEPLAK
jgi:DNA-binding phage protein